jgi:hypothetical protein
MKKGNAAPRPGFRSKDRTLGILGAWTSFALFEVYAVTSGLGYLSVKNPADPISDPYLSIMSLLIVLMVPFMVLAMVAVHSYAAPEYKSFSLAALAFMILCAAITSCVNYALFVMARQAGPTTSMWVASFISTGWPPLPQVMDYFAWDWFFALSMLLGAPVFRGGRLANGVRWVMLLSAALCILGLVWFPFSPSQASVISILGWGVAGPIVFLLLANLFTRTQPDQDLTLPPDPASTER